METAANPETGRAAKFWEKDLWTWDASQNVGLRCHYVASVFAAKMFTASGKQSAFCLCFRDVFLRECFRGVFSERMCVVSRPQAESSGGLIVNVSSFGGLQYAHFANDSASSTSKHTLTSRQLPKYRKISA